MAAASIEGSLNSLLISLLSEMATSKIAVYSLSGRLSPIFSKNSTNTRFITDLKNTTDDALPNYLTSLKFKQSHVLTDVRLALSSTAVIIAAITFYADYKLGWDSTKQGTFWAVIVYFILNGALTFWIWGVEKGKIFNGEGGDGALVRKTAKAANLGSYNIMLSDPRGTALE